MQCRTICHLLFFAVVVWASVTAADVYRYRGPDGKWVITNTPPPDSANVVSRGEEGAAERLPRREGLAPRREAAPRQEESLTPTPVSPAAPTVPTARSVDTRQLGMIQPGMNTEEVRQRLGPPADVQDGGIVKVRRRRGGPIYEVPREKWVYPASVGAPGTVITFVDGRVSETERVR